MTNPNKRKGDTEERTVRDLLRTLGFPRCERTRAGYERDTGDLHLDPTVAGPSVICQVKNVRTPDWTGWLTDLADQKHHSGALHAFLAVKRTRPGKPPLRLAVMPLEDFADLLRAATSHHPTHLEPVDTLNSDHT